MRKRRCNWMILALAAGVAWVGVAAASVPSDIRQTLQQWFDGLRNGDTVALASLLGPEERARNGAMLQNPGYSGFLRERYRGARLAIIDHRRDPEGVWLLDVEIALGPDDVIRERYVFAGPQGAQRIARRIPLP